MSEMRSALERIAICTVKCASHFHRRRFFLTNSQTRNHHETHIVACCRYCFHFGTVQRWRAVRVVYRVRTLFAFFCGFYGKIKAKCGSNWKGSLERARRNETTWAVWIRCWFFGAQALQITIGRVVSFGCAVLFFRCVFVIEGIVL